MVLPWASYRAEEAKLALVAVGAYQLGVILEAALRLKERDVPHQVAYVLEPARLDAQSWNQVLPAAVEKTVVVTHTRPHVVYGFLGPLHERGQLRVLGYRNNGGTLDTPGMLFVNGASWAHALVAAGWQSTLGEEEQAALRGERSPQGVICPLP